MAKRRARGRAIEAATPQSPQRLRRTASRARAKLRGGEENGSPTRSAGDNETIEARLTRTAAEQTSGTPASAPTSDTIAAGLEKYCQDRADQRCFRQLRFQAFAAFFVATTAVFAAASLQWLGRGTAFFAGVAMVVAGGLYELVLTWRLADRIEQAHAYERRQTVGSELPFSFEGSLDRLRASSRDNLVPRINLVVYGLYLLFWVLFVCGYVGRPG